jgi:SNF2 family DNA or RNA helicase
MASDPYGSMQAFEAQAPAQEIAALSAELLQVSTAVAQVLPAINRVLAILVPASPPRFYRRFRIKHCNRKKNIALSCLQAQHRIILTGTPIQNTLREFWTLLRFVSPAYFSEDPEWLDAAVEELSGQTVLAMRSRISSHLLRRTTGEVEDALAPTEEIAVFVGSTQVQNDLIRLAKLHQLWRLRGVQVMEADDDALHEVDAVCRICSHPFLIPEAEVFYAHKLADFARVDLIACVSSKFQWLDRDRDRHRTIGETIRFH